MYRTETEILDSQDYKHIHAETYNDKLERELIKLQLDDSEYDTITKRHDKIRGALAVYQDIYGEFVYATGRTLTGKPIYFEVTMKAGTYPEEYVLSPLDVLDISDMYAEPETIVPYNLPNIRKAVETNVPVFIVDSYTAVAQLAERGYVATCLPGNFHQWKAYLNRWFQDAIVIVTPSNAELNAGRKIAKQLEEYARAVRLVNFFDDYAVPGSNGSMTGYIDSGQKIELLLNGLIQEKDKFDDISFEELLNRPVPEFLVPDLVPEQALVGIYGSWGSGKTFAAVDIAMQLVNAGKDVVYANSEQLGRFFERITAWKNYYADSTFNTSKFHYKEAVPNLLDASDVDAFILSCKDYQPKLVVIDTYTNAVSGANTNDAAVASAAMESCNRIILETGATVLLVAHNGKDDSKGIAGSKVVENRLDVIIKAVKAGDQINLSCHKTRTESWPVKAYRMEMATSHKGFECPVLVPLTYKEQQEQNEHTHDKAVLEALFGTPEGLKHNEIKRATGLQPTQLARTFARLIENGQVEKHGSLYIITKKGKFLVEPVRIDENILRK